MAEEQQSPIKTAYNSGTVGLNMDQSVNQIKPGTLTYALNASLENFDASSVNYQNEQGNELCVSFPEEFILIGTHFINEKNKHIFYITNPNTNESEIGYMDNNDCIYHTLVSASCLNFNINYPIHKTVHKITNCTIEIYWTDGLNPRRYLDINNIPKLLQSGSQLCDPIYTDELDCNQLKLQPNFIIPELNVRDVTTGGELIAGTYQFAIQYADAAGNPFTSYYSVTNPTPIADIAIVTVNYNYTVGKSIILDITDLDVTGQYQYYNIAVIKTVNGISSVELVGTYFIEQNNDQITYTGQNQTQIKLTINDIFEKFPYYEIAQDITSVQDILVWKGLTSIDRINYQEIASGINLSWETYRIPATENYANEINATNLRGYLRDEVYAFEIVFLLKNGKQTDGFHIPGRAKNFFELTSPNILDTDPDFIGEPEQGTNYSPYWKIYNTASVTGTSTDYSSDPSYKGSYQYGEFAYWESTEEYPCNDDLWGNLAGQPIRHHKFPDILVSPAFESKLFTNADSLVMGNDAVFPIGVRIDNSQVRTLVNNSSLTTEQKADIIGYKIVRGDRGTNKSIVAKGILRNVGEYEREDQKFYFPNYPYNDVNEDPFLLERNNAYDVIAEPWLVICNTAGPGKYTYVDVNTGKEVTKNIAAGATIEFLSISRPIRKGGTIRVLPGNFDVWYATGDDSIGYYLKWDTPLTDGKNSSIFKKEFINGNSNPFVPFGEEYALTAVNAGVLTECKPNQTNCVGIPVLLTQPIVQPLNSIIQNSVNTPFVFNIVPTTSRRSSLNPLAPPQLKAFTTDVSKYRQIFNSPETSFGQPFLGSILKLESVLFGRGRAHFVSVRDNAKYKLLSEEAQVQALDSSRKLGAITNPFNATAMFTAYQAYLTIYVNGITRRNYAYSFNSIADYNYSESIPNNLGVKQRQIEYKQYLIPGVQSVGEEVVLNNFQRESSVFIKTVETRNETTISPLLFPSDSPNMIVNGQSIVTDKTRFTISNSDACTTPAREQNTSVVSYYASLKNEFVNQWGQIYSYETIDTGFQRNINSTGTSIVFGGDTFISRFAFKTKLPFFIDNRVNAPDDSDIFYDEIGNIAYPKYWHSARSILKNYILNGESLSNIISYKAHNFDCPNDTQFIENPLTGNQTTTTTTTFNSNNVTSTIASSTSRTFYDGYFYLFAYGIPNFYCESSYNTDLRQAFNNKEGDFWPHVTTGIPDDWVQETNVSIANDNTYTYNVTFSKQNKENTFTHLPPDWTEQLCYTYYPFRATYSDSQNTDSDNRVNSWLTYRALSYFDFPQNYGNLTSLDGIQNKAVLARFENKSLLYNNLLTIDTSNPQAAYVGNPTLFKGAPPIDFAETDLGYVGSQNKFLLKIPQGQITIDAKRGQVFLIAGSESVDLSAFGSGMNRFFTDHLAFEILRYFPNVNTDNHFTGVGLHGVFDSKFDRVIISKLDYIPLDSNIKYDDVNKEFYIENIVNNFTFRTKVYLTDKEYFCNKSWTISYNMNTKTWVSFHSYIPNFYIGENNFFYSGINGCCEDFELVAGELIPNPPTTTTTTTPAPITTTTTTTEFLDCTFTGISREVTCVFSGTATEQNAPCSRPEGLAPFTLITGYNIISPPSTVVSTGSQVAACNAITYVTNNSNFSYNQLFVDAESLSLNQTVYISNGTLDCSVVADGWYFTNQSANTTQEVYHIVSGRIVEIAVCSTPTTTTTTTTVLPCSAFRASKTTAGITTISYTNCSGVPATVQVGLVGGGYSEVTFCASCCVSVAIGVTLTNLGSC